MKTCCINFEDSTKNIVPCYNGQMAEGGVEVSRDVWQTILTTDDALSLRDALVLRGVCKESRGAFGDIALRIPWTFVLIVPKLLCLSPRADHVLCGTHYGDCTLFDLSSCIIDNGLNCAFFLNPPLCENAQGRSLVACAILCHEFVRGEPFSSCACARAPTPRGVVDVFAMTRHGSQADYRR